MKLHMIILLGIIAVLTTISPATAQHYQATGEPEPPTAPDLSLSSILNAIVSLEPVQRKINNVVTLIDLKLRLVRLLKSVLTRENFVLLRRLLDVIISICQFANNFLPEPTAQDIAGGGFSLITSLFPMLNIPSEQHELPDHYGPPLSDKYGPPPPVMMMSKPLVSLSLAGGGGATRFDRSANLTAATDNKEDYDNDNNDEDVVEDVENEFGEQVKHLDHLIYNTAH